jgi:hypothetical protein
MLCKRVRSAVATLHNALLHQFIVAAVAATMHYLTRAGRSIVATAVVAVVSSSFSLCRCTMPAFTIKLTEG